MDRRTFVTRGMMAVGSVAATVLPANAAPAKYRPLYTKGPPGLFTTPPNALPLIGGPNKVYPGDIEPTMKGFVVNDSRAKVLLIWRDKRNPNGQLLVHPTPIQFGVARCFSLDTKEWMSGIPAFGKVVLRERSRYYRCDAPIVLPTKVNYECVAWTVDGDLNGRHAVYFSNFSNAIFAAKVVYSFGACVLYDTARSGWGGYAFTFGEDMPRAGFPAADKCKGSKPF